MDLDAPQPPAGPDMKKGPAWRRYLPLALLAAVAVLVFSMGWHRQLTFENLALHSAMLRHVIDAHYALAALGFVLGYVLVAALSLPLGLYMTLTGGFLFGALAGTFFTVLGATLGATCIFLAARGALAEPLRAKAGPTARRLEDGFRRDAFNYLLTLRLLPVLPFWLVNIVPGLLGMATLPFMAATFLGIIPATAIYSWVGQGIGAVLRSCAPGAACDVSVSGIILRPAVLGPMLALAALALAPVVWKRLRRKGTPHE